MVSSSCGVEVPLPRQIEQVRHAGTGTQNHSKQAPKIAKLSGSDADCKGLSQHLFLLSKTIRSDILLGCPMCGTLRDDVVSCLFSGITGPVRELSETPFIHRRKKASNARTETVEFDPRCPGQIHTLRSGADPGYESIDC